LAYTLVVLFVETRQFTARVRSLLSDDEYRELQCELAERPDAGVVIPGTHGLRKLRFRMAGRGKRGGVRTIYYWAQSRSTILLLFLFAKNERDDLTPDQRAALKRIVEAEYP
jgi:hypothetical protein